MFDEDKSQRHNVTIDAMSILENDAVDESIEETVFANVMLVDMIRLLPDPLDKFVIIAIVYGFKKNEIGFMLKVDPSTVTRIHQEIQSKLRRRFPEGTSQTPATPKNEEEAIKQFFKAIFPNDPAIRRLK